MKKRKYSSCMLPNVNYRTLSSDFFDELTDLEYETQVCLRELTEAVKELFQKANMITIDEVMISHLSAYLGFMTVAGLGDKEAKILQDQRIPAALLSLSRRSPNTARMREVVFCNN